MKAEDKLTELLEFLKYHTKNNPKISLYDIQPLLNEVLLRIGEDKLKGEKHGNKK